MDCKVNIITHFLCLMNLHFMFYKRFHQLSPLRSSKLELYFPFQLLMKTRRDQKLDTLIKKISNFKSCLLHLFVHLWLFCLLWQSIAHPHYFGKRGWRGYCHHHQKSWHMCTTCVSFYEVHMGCWITKLL